MPFDQTVAGLIDVWMNAHSHPCKVCGGEDWSTMPEFLCIPTGTPAGTALLNTPRTYWIAVVCDSCGYSFLVAPKAMGIPG